MRTPKGQRLFWSRHIRSRPVTGTRPCHGGYGQSRRARLVTAAHVAHVGVASSLGGPGTARSGSQDLRVSLGSTRISPADCTAGREGGGGGETVCRESRGWAPQARGAGVGEGRGLKGCRGGDRGWRGGDGERRGLEAERRAGRRLVGCGCGGVEGLAFQQEGTGKGMQKGGGGSCWAEAANEPRSLRVTGSQRREGPRKW